jgi:hypothetical protein
MRRLIIYVAAASMVANFAGAQKASVAALGSIEGDLYVLTQAGETRRLPAHEVIVVRRGFVESVIAPQCRKSDSAYFAKSDRKLSPQEVTALLTKSLRDTAPDSVIVRLRGSLDSAAAGRAKTNVNAHFRIEGIPPGDYTIFAHSYLRSQHVRWMVPVHVLGGQSLAVDLDPSNMQEVNVGDEFCGLIHRTRTG